LLHLERVGAALRRLGEEREVGILTGRHLAAGPGHLLDDGAVAGAGLLEHTLPARARYEGVDREALRDGQDDLRRRRALLLGRDSECVQLLLLRERHER